MTIEDIDAEVRIGLGSCCVAGGSKEILSEILDIKERYNLNIRLKPVDVSVFAIRHPLWRL